MPRPLAPTKAAFFFLRINSPVANSKNGSRRIVLGLRVQSYDSSVASVGKPARLMRDWMADSWLTPAGPSQNLANSSDTDNVRLPCCCRNESSCSSVIFIFRISR